MGTFSILLVWKLVFSISRDQLLLFALKDKQNSTARFGQCLRLCASLHCTSAQLSLGLMPLLGGCYCRWKVSGIKLMSTVRLGRMPLSSLIRVIKGRTQESVNLTFFFSFQVTVSRLITIDSTSRELTVIRHAFSLLSFICRSMILRGKFEAMLGLWNSCRTLICAWQRWFCHTQNGNLS